MKIQFTFMGIPIAKGRPKFARYGNFVKAYTPQDTINAEQDFKYQSLRYRPQTPIIGAISLKIDTYRPMQKGMSKKKQELAKAGILRPTVKPDWDNLAKLVCDAMNGIFYKDDNQIVCCIVNKYYSDIPRIEIFLETL
jgi:Holliday junction resolvase RusA-like endonuclease